MVVVHRKGTVHGREGRGDDRHHMLEVIVVRPWVPGNQVLALPVLGALLDFGQHYWQRPEPFGKHLHE